MKAWMMDYAYLVTLGAVIAVVAGSAVYTQQVKRRQEAGVQAAANAPELEMSASPEPQPTVTPLPTIAPITVRLVLLAAASSLWPVEGEILRAFDAQTLVWWESLGCWRTHMGLDIAGEAGQAVTCCADGKVKSSSWDELWGWRVMIEQTDGRQVTYCGMESSVVSIGERVTRGQTIGTLLARIPCEAELPAHLHLQVSNKGTMQDPEAMLPER
ncbi:MAG: peptidoglycan DD-metalloendopeptidase family protein [Candidatus Ventricola sp.]